ncbi:MAG: hypothetical protein K9M45_04685 [Kiritimatiellales bacterium]|nr:hypothetical protein [Kiritimatiellales bacterium]
MKKLILIVCLIATASLAAPPRFSEAWGYLYKGEEKYFPNPAPFTDIACFSAAVNGDGGLTGGHPQPPVLKGALASARYHLVVTIPWNSTLAHIYLDPKLPFRNRIIAAIVERSKPFDGVQVDFEGIAKADGTAYLNFLAAVKKALPKDKLFSVAVMARWEAWIQRSGVDAFDYPFINRFADRVVVMAYPEHHSSGEAGPMASLDWCEKIYAYALKTIDPNKLVMGLPLYGRAWQKKTLARSYKGSEVWKEIEDKQIKPSTDWKTGGSYSFSETVDIDVHYETIQSLEAKLNLYQSKPIRGVAFWRIGQEPPGFWPKGF